MKNTTQNQLPAARRAPSLPSGKGWISVAIITGIVAIMAVTSMMVIQENKARVKLLAEEHLPLVKSAQDLRMSLAANRSILYAYYLTADREQFASEFVQNYASLTNTYQQIQRSYPNAPGLEAIDHLIIDALDLGNEFDRVMRADQIDWDQARAVLNRFPALAQQMETQSELLTRWIRGRIVASAELSLDQTRQTLWIVTLLSATALLAAGLMIRHNVRRLRALREQARLASFPNRNPLPVLAVSDNGNIDYANDSATNVAGKLLPDGNMRTLLPDDLPRLMQKARMNNEYHVEEYQQSGIFWSLGIHWLEDFREFHLYLNDITDRKNAEAKLSFLAYNDPLTGLPNRHQFELDITNQAPRTPFLIALLKLDKLQKVVDSGGLTVADQVLKICSFRLSTAIGEAGESIKLYRFDGNVFCAVLLEQYQALPRLQSMVQSIQPVITVDEYEYFMSLSAGVTLSQTNHTLNGTELEELLRQADSAMNMVRKAGGNGIHHYDQHLDRQRQLSLDGYIRHAIERQELHLAYQPQMDLADTGNLSVEALLRWRHPALGTISPIEFIPIAEETGAIIDIGNWVLHQCCTQALQWHQQLGRTVNIAINVSPRQLYHGDLVHDIQTALKTSGLDANCLELEITETTALEDFDAACQIMEQLKALGVRLALDDFGTGYSSLSYLAQLPIDILKIDKQFIDNLAQFEQYRAITRSIIELGHHLGLIVVAEGIEHREQYELLAGWGCDKIQGYLHSPPLLANQIPGFFDSTYSLPC